MVKRTDEWATRTTSTWQPHWANVWSRRAFRSQSVGESGNKGKGHQETRTQSHTRDAHSNASGRANESMRAFHAQDETDWRWKMNVRTNNGQDERSMMNERKEEANKEDYMAMVMSERCEWTSRTDESSACFKERKLPTKKPFFTLKSLSFRVFTLWPDGEWKVNHQNRHANVRFSVLNDFPSKRHQNGSARVSAGRVQAGEMTSKATVTNRSNLKMTNIERLVWSWHL